MAHLSSAFYDGAVHCMGNGQMLVFARGSDAFDIAGASYSSVSLCRTYPADDDLPEEIRRIPGTAIWEHVYSRGGREIACMTEFVDAQLPCYVRDFNAAEAVEFALEFTAGSEILCNGTLFSLAEDRGILITKEAGAYIYGNYPNLFPAQVQILALGDIRIEGSRITIGPGHARLLFVSGQELPDCLENAHMSMNTPCGVLRERTREFWQVIQDKGLDADACLPASLPERQKLVDATDSVRVLLMAQQSVQGGLVCGPTFRWAAVRDQYGAFRGFLSLGLFRQAKAILQYELSVFLRHGCIHNGQYMGPSPFFHVHENDGSEITGYLLLEAFQFFDTTGDETFLRELLPMLKWAFRAQLSLLSDGMLPFNGDETYIACGILPRSAICDGSAEATMLFFTGGNRLISYLQKIGDEDTALIGAGVKALASVRDRFRAHFLRGNRLMANDPARRHTADLPSWRHGVCEGCWNPPQYYFGWTRKNSYDRYLCPACSVSRQLERSPEDVYMLNSVALAHGYLDADLLDAAEEKNVAGEILQAYRSGVASAGYLPSREGTGITVGYDYGLLLMNLVRHDDPAAESVYLYLMDLLDETGAWCEFYRNGRPWSTRCRPWESGVNIAACLEYAKHRSENKSGRS